MLPLDQQSTGLILRTYPLTESSLIIRWLTPEFGRLSTVAKGARRPKSPFLGKLDLFYLARFSFRRSRRSELHILREVAIRDFHLSLRHELGYLQQAAYCAALIEQVTETETPLPSIFHLLAGLLDALPKQPPHPLTVAAFELKLLGEQGLAPDLAQTDLPPPRKAILAQLLSDGWPPHASIQAGPADVKGILHFLDGFLLEHFGKVPPGRTAATLLS